MESSRRKTLEVELRALCEAHRYGEATELALETYGPDIRHLMMAILKNESRVDDAFSAFSESLLTGLPRFRWESSFRTWIYGMAHNICMQSFRSPGVREQPISDGVLDGQPMLERSVTQPWLRTDTKSRFRALRERLNPQEQRILYLRVNQGLSWQQIAQVMADRELSAQETGKKAAVLRQQFQRIKTRLRAFAIEEHLLPSSQD